MDDWLIKGAEADEVRDGNAAELGAGHEEIITVSSAGALGV